MVHNPDSHDIPYYSSDSHKIEPFRVDGGSFVSRLPSWWYQSGPSLRPLVSWLLGNEIYLPNNCTSEIIMDVIVLETCHIWDLVTSFILKLTMRNIGPRQVLCWSLISLPKCLVWGMVHRYLSHRQNKHVFLYQLETIVKSMRNQKVRCEMWFRAVDAWWLNTNSFLMGGIDRDMVMLGYLTCHLSRR